MDNERNDEFDLELERPNYVGRFVCYEQLDGGACWGKIKDLVYINTQNGEKPAFILTNRIVRYSRNKNVKTFRRFYPNYNEGDLSLSRPVDAGSDGLEDGDYFLENRFIGRDSLLRLDSINVERDVVDCSKFLDLLSEGDLFLAVLRGNIDYEANNNKTLVGGQNILEIGLRCLLATEFEKVKEELNKRLNHE